MGHEITHGFDDQGRQYDKNGDLNNWWNEETNAAFMKRAQCLIDQYGNYTMPEVEMNVSYYYFCITRNQSIILCVS